MTRELDHAGPSFSRKTRRKPNPKVAKPGRMITGVLTSSQPEPEATRPDHITTGHPSTSQPTSDQHHGADFQPSEQSTPNVPSTIIAIPLCSLEEADLRTPLNVTSEALKEVLETAKVSVGDHSSLYLTSMIV